MTAGELQELEGVSLSSNYPEGAGIDVRVPLGIHVPMESCLG